MTRSIAIVAAVACWTMALGAGLPALVEAWTSSGQRHAGDVCWSEHERRRAPGDACDGVIQQ